MESHYAVTVCCCFESLCIIARRGIGATVPNILSIFADIIRPFGFKFAFSSYTDIQRNDTVTAGCIFDNYSIRTCLCVSRPKISVGGFGRADVYLIITAVIYECQFAQLRYTRYRIHRIKIYSTGGECFSEELIRIVLFAQHFFRLNNRIGFDKQMQRLAVSTVTAERFLISVVSCSIEYLSVKIIRLPVFNSNLKLLVLFRRRHYGKVQFVSKTCLVIPVFEHVIHILLVFIFVHRRNRELMSVKGVSRFIANSVILFLRRIHLLECQFEHAITSVHGKQAVVILSFNISFSVPPIGLPFGDAFFLFEEI